MESIYNLLIVKDVQSDENSDSLYFGQIFDDDIDE